MDERVPIDGRALAIRLVANAEASLDDDVVRVRSCLRQLACLLAQEAGDAPAGTTLTLARGGLAPWQVRRVAAYVEAHLGATITVGDLAAEARLSNGHFCRAFKATLGETPHTYVVRRRVEHAQLLMLTTADPLSQIATMCGLTDQAHLTRLFRRLVGQTPLNWRRTWRQAA